MRTRLIRLVAAIALSIGLTWGVVGPLPAVASSQVTATESVNVRSGPSSRARIVGGLSRGQTVTALSKASGWTKITFGTLTAYVSSTYLSAGKDLPATGKVNAGAVKVTTTSVNLRKGAGRSYDVIKVLPAKARVTLTGKAARGFTEVVNSGSTGWVSTQYLTSSVTNLPSLPRLPKVTGSRYATATLDVRSTSANKYTKITEVTRGTKLAITGKVSNARMQIIYRGAVRWVTAKYLSRSKPATAGKGPATAAEKGLKPNAIKVRRAALARFPQIKTIGGVRPDPIPDHPSGRALDLMIPNYKSRSGRALGRDVATWARTNAASLGINYVIWDQHIWNIQRSGEGWRYMAGRGSDSANHKNHVHITVYAAGQP